MTSQDLIDMIRQMDPTGKERICIETDDGIRAIIGVRRLNNPNLTKVKLAVRGARRE